MYGRIHDAGMGPYPPRVTLAIRIPGWGFHNVRGGIEPGEIHVRHQYIGVVDVWKDFCSGDGTLSFPGGAGSTNARMGFPYRAGIDPGDHRFRPCLLVL